MAFYKHIIKKYIIIFSKTTFSPITRVISQNFLIHIFDFGIIIIIIKVAYFKHIFILKLMNLKNF